MGKLIDFFSKNYDFLVVFCDKISNYYLGKGFHRDISPIPWVTEIDSISKKTLTLLAYLGSIYKNTIFLVSLNFRQI